MNAFALAGLLLNLLLNAWLIPTQGAAGAALATLLTQSAICLLQFGASYQHQQWRTQPLFLVRIALFMALALAAHQLFPPQPHAKSLLLGSAASLLLLLLFFGQPIYLRLKAQFDSRF
jgi:O-antigen/teichoic acid export membrane protein